MIPDNNRPRLQDMRLNARRAVDFAGAKGAGDLLREYAVLHAIQIVGEAAAKISDQTKAGTPEVPWPQIIGMRHILVHAYDGVDPGFVDLTVRESLPTLVGLLNDILAEDTP